ncbi:T9SS type A sorting domain-containing protein [Bacteroidota bacterium]
MNLKFFITIIYMIFGVVTCYAQATDYTPQYARFNINNISTIIYNDGRMDHNIETGEAAFEYPKGSSKTAVYQSGFFWGGGILQLGYLIGGSIYRTGLKPGRILPDGTPEDPNSERVRVYRVRNDYKYAGFTDDIEKGDGSYEEIRSQYEENWMEWPADWGAPFMDVDGDGNYNYEIDIPGVTGAHQSIWFVANDFDSVQADYFVPLGYPNLPAGIEMQITIWGYDHNDYLGNVIFKKYKIINKSPNEYQILDMFISQFSDPYIDENNDEFVGCDTVLNLGFAYNPIYLTEKYSSEPPSIGCLLLHGPSINMEESVSNNNSRNLDMTSFHYVPYGFHYGESHMILALYAMLNGRMPHNGQYIFLPDEFGGGKTKFPFSGDPVTRIGWLDSFERELWDSYGHRIMVNSGPFNMAYGDTQEVVFAVIAAGATEGVDNLGAVSLLKHYAKQVKQFYDNNYQTAKAEIKPVVSASSFGREVVLLWGTDIDNVNKIEKKEIHDFTFQGYNVYQFPTDTSSISNGVKIATFDKVDGVANIIEDKLQRITGRVVPTVVQTGGDTGTERYIKIEKDYLWDKPLNNGTKYHFGVTAYYFNDTENTSPVTLETEPNIVSVFPQSEIPGKRYGAEIGDRISVDNYGSTSDVDVMVIDPSQLTGHDYQITFHESAGQLLWDLEDVTLSEIKLTDQTNISGTDEYYIVDGFRIIIAQDTGVQSDSVQSTSGRLTSEDVFTFTTPGVIEDTELAKFDVEKINVFPNPYYGGHSNELSQYQNYVMFNHLPKRAAIRIFNLAGHLVRTLHKDDDTQFYLWDLQNENRLLAPSGLYIIYIEMPDLQKVKVLKLAIVQREVVPGNF